MTLVKICGITNIEDAIAAVEAGADYLGFIFADSPRRIDVIRVKEILSVISSECEKPAIRHDSLKADSSSCLLGMTDPNGTSVIKTVGVFTEESDDVLRVMDECELDFAQLHGNQNEGFARKIGMDRVIRVARVKDQSSIDALADLQAAFYLLDTYKKGLAGGTGETFNWKLAVGAKNLGKPIILSGGLNSDNIESAIKTVRPYGVDISSGVEINPGKKDHKKIKELIDNVRAADNAS